MRMYGVLAMSAVLMLPIAASAQTVYKQVRPDGSIIYTDKPEPGANVVESRDIPPPPPPPPAPGSSKQRAPTQAPARSEVKPAPKADTRQVAFEKADKEVRDAEAALDAAKRAREAGVEAQEGERLGTVKGGSRLSEGYEERQRKLEQTVADAEARLQRALDARNALR